MVELHSAARQKIEDRYRAAKRRLLFLDYDGTLAPIAERPEDAIPSRALVALLKKLSDDARNDVVVISGRPHETLEEWLGYLPIEFVAEHGAMRREKDGAWQMMMQPNEAQIAAGASLLAGLAAQHPDAVLEKKRVSTTLHYRQEPTLNAAEIKRWKTQHTQELARLCLNEIYGKKIIELVPRNVNKGTAVRHWLEHGGWDFVLAAGDDATDETMFGVLSADSLSFHIGNNTVTAAQYTLSEQKDFIELLESFTR